MKIKDSERLLKAAKLVISTRADALNGISLSLPDNVRDAFHNKHSDAILELTEAVKECEIDRF